MTLEQFELLKIPEVRAAFIEAMQRIVDRAVISEMVAAIETNDVERLIRASGFTEAALDPFITKLEEAVKESARITASTFPEPIKTAQGVFMFMFNPRNPRLEQEIRTNSSQLITRIADEARENIRRALEQGVIAGENPRRTAINIVGAVDPRTKQRVGGIIGLTENQTGWVNNATRYLKTGDRKYLDLELRDRRFDSIVRKSIESGKPLKQEQVDKIIASYKNRALKYRGDVIARTETLQAINRGEYAAALQLVEEGLIKRENITKEWDDTGDGRVRPEHRHLATKYGKDKGIPLDAPFVAMDGSRLLYPGDTTLGAPAAQVVQCRCRMRTRINFLAEAE